MGKSGLLIVTLHLFSEKDKFGILKFWQFHVKIV